ncbi:MAG TPA: DoxX family protein [Candidatus Angelobacter sp.]
MQSDTESPTAADKELWAGRIISGLVIAFMLFDTVIHLMKITPVVQAFQQLGWPISLAFVLGIIELLCVVFYLYPRTSIVGAILLTGYLGGAVVTQLRVGNPLFGEALFPVYVGILAWGGLYLREPGLRALIPIVKTRSTAENAGDSRKKLWTGRVVSAIVALMILFASSVKLVKAPAVVEGFAKQGFPEHLVIVVGIIELLCAVIYLVPRTAVLGAILMTGLMGGATATNVRVGDPSLIVTLLLGILAWAGLFLRNERLRKLMPLRS